MPSILETSGLSKDVLAKRIADKWVDWNSAKDKWLKERAELRNYLFATSTRDTTNDKLPWKNSTVTPKLTQIRDNLHANYMAALFPREDWFQWRGEDYDSVSKEKRDTIEGYMRPKLKASNFELTVSQLVLDYIDYGNVFAGHEYVEEIKKDPSTGENVVVYCGSRLFRISPYDIVFDVTAPSFDKAPCIVRRLRSIGDLKKDAEEKPYLKYDLAVIDKCSQLRTSGVDVIDALKQEGLAVDGFGSLESYFDSGMVELLDFYGDIYDTETKEYKKDVLMTIADRRYVLRNVVNPSWTGTRPIKHCGWRVRPDNLWAQGPLDQLVGLQYRIDHLENLKADVFDQIAHPVVVIKGNTTEQFVFGPGQTFYAGEDGDLSLLRADASALSADMEIQTLMDRMEELAGAPRQAMGIRTPGEKTKYEVQVLENGAGRIFQAKVNWFERNIVEPSLNSMFEENVQNFTGKDTSIIKDNTYGMDEFKTITKDDVTAKGRLYAIGARHFAEQATAAQELTQTLQIVESLPQVKVHISGKAVAKALEEVFGWKNFNIVRDNAAVHEQMETARLQQASQENVQTEGAMPSELQPEDYEATPEGGVSETPTSQV